MKSTKKTALTLLKTEGMLGDRVASVPHRRMTTVLNVPLQNVRL
jgi:hypothetical protein